MEVILERLKGNGDYAYEAIFLTQLKSYSFGQMDSNDFILYAPTVEYNHCIFHNKPNGLFVEVLKSSWGVLKINGRKYSSNSVVRLNDNDIVNIGLLLKYKVKIKAAIPIADGSDSDCVKNENDTEDALPCHNVNYSNIENLENEATLSAETIESEILQKVKENSSEEIESGLSLQEIDAAMQIEIEKEKNELENSSSFDSSAEKESYHSDSSFQPEHLSDYLLRKEYLSDSLSEKEPLSDSLPKKVPLPDSTDNKLLPNSSSKEENHPSTKHSAVSLTKKVLCLKIEQLSSVFLEKKKFSPVSKMQLSSDPKKPLATEFSQKKPKKRKPSEKQFSCGFCDKLFTTNLSLDDHLLLHKCDRPFKCNKCYKSFRGQQRLQKHSKCHSTEMVFGCVVCGKKFKSKATTRLHVLRVHSGEKQTCKICKKAFGCKTYLNQHMLVHSTEKKFKCSLCEKRFKIKRNLRRHMLIHSTEKNFKCSHCDNCFKSSSKLISHVRKLHSKKGLFKCKFCQKQFFGQKRCDEHQQIHTSEKSDTCETCGKLPSKKEEIEKD